ncbi:hypothetical protein EGR_07144 [Echinococcus granulosus]|uniref:Uncharacterized protein n=1 Tax=Echinococcus granulosus TaxID=6210 RepID=W6U9I7_ECHGR|nr:hypothetical protein EGR_07144 [Echinococcus granulosus]EUB58038.1 hypothetical protein EGR_07144 [Echinococcus granulosus]
MSCRTRSCENSAKYAQNMYCKCKIYNQEPSHPRCGVGEIDYLKDLKLCHCIKDLPYPRAFPVKCCNPVVKKTKIKEKYRDGELERQTEERYVAEYCSSKKECVELRYPPKKLPRSSTLPKYLRTDDCKSENCDPPTTYYQPARRNLQGFLCVSGAINRWKEITCQKVRRDMISWLVGGESSSPRSPVSKLRRVEDEEGCKKLF